MLPHTPATEKVATLAAAGILATAAMFACLHLSIPFNYGDFMAGYSTFRDQGKIQDLLAAPVFITVFSASALFLSHLFSRLPARLGAAKSTEWATQILWWCIPALVSIGNLAPGGSFEPAMPLVVLATILCLAILAARQQPTGIPASPAAAGATLLAALLVCLIPSELQLVAGRFFSAPSAPYTATPGAFAILPILLPLALCATLAGYLWLPGRMARALPEFLLLAQIGLPSLFFTLLPARLASPDGNLMEYQHSPLLAAIAITLAAAGTTDVILRYRRGKAANPDSPDGFFSPLAIFALLFTLKSGATVPPALDPNDYHAGESLLGWWSYLRGSIPYVDYQPPHGLLEDDLPGLLCHFLLDGTAASMGEAKRLAFALIALPAFLALRRTTGSTVLASASVLLCGERLGWLFLIPFLCIWLSRKLMNSPLYWLAVWFVTAPVIILGHPAQGTLLVTASGLIAGRMAWKALHTRPEPIHWRACALSFAVLLAISLATPLIPMLFSAIRFILENAAINQIAFGIPWKAGWVPIARLDSFFEIIRVSWIAIPVVCLLRHIADRKLHPGAATPLAPSVILAFSLLIIPYTMGRIDPAPEVSRMGMFTIFSWTTLLPLAIWNTLAVNHRPVLLLLAACFATPLIRQPLSSSNIAAAMAPAIMTGPLENGPQSGLPNVGIAAVDGAQWDRLCRINSLLESKLAPGEPYLDLTSRNAHYFYLDRKPVISITAPYNLASPRQQRRIIAEIAARMPRLALLDADNMIADGGGLALRSPLLHRFIIDNYVPRLENGLIVGYGKQTIPRQAASGTVFEIPVMDYTNQSWDKGVHRTGTIVRLANTRLFSFLPEGARVQLATGESRVIIRALPDAGTLQLSGPRLAANLHGFPLAITANIRADSLPEFETSLFEEAFASPDLGLLPAAWGRSMATLNAKMTMVRSFSSLPPKLVDMAAAAGSYNITGPHPTLEFQFPDYGLAGRDAGILAISFFCQNLSENPKLRVFWSGGNPGHPVDSPGVTLGASNGILLVPLDASSRWVNADAIHHVGIDFSQAAEYGSTITLSDITLYQRNDFR